MKNLAPILTLALLLSGASNAFAADQVKFDVVANLGICTLVRGSPVSCDSGNAKPETITMDLVDAGCKQDCKYNDHADFTKTYTLVRPDTKEKLSYEVEVIIDRLSIQDDTDYSVEIYLAPKGGNRASTRNAIASVKDFSALASLFLEGKGVIRKVNGKHSEATPALSVKNVQIIPKN